MKIYELSKSMVIKFYVSVYLQAYLSRLFEGEKLDSPHRPPEPYTCFQKDMERMFDSVKFGEYAPAQVQWPRDITPDLENL